MDGGSPAAASDIPVPGEHEEDPNRVSARELRDFRRFQQVEEEKMRARTKMMEEVGHQARRPHGMAPESSRTI